MYGSTRLLLALWCLVLLDLSEAGVELLKNPDMEMVHFDHNWSCQGGCTLTSSNDRHSGWHSVKVTNRRHMYDRLAQNVDVTAGSLYKFTAYIKLLNLEPRAMYETVEASMACTKNGHKVYLKFSHDPYIIANSWTKVGGTQQIPDGAHSCYVYFKVPGLTVEYLVDTASLQSLDDNNNWRTEANTRIEQLRKADITFMLSSVPTNENYEVEIIQNKHEFAFGSAVGAKQIVDPAYRKYAAAFYENFEWAVLENALKWKLMERTQGHINYDVPINALHALIGNGTKVRGHNVFWATPTHIPAWISSLHGQQLLDVMDTRIKGVIGHTKGLVKHWDVNNENIHGDWYEKATYNANITQKMFHDIHAIDPDVKLFLNDFGVMESYAAMPLRHQAEYFVKCGVPVYGVGIQSHLHDVNINIQHLKNNLDTVAEAGLPIWITELSLASHDVHAKASALEDVLTLYFSHPAVEGVLFWGFWDGKIFSPETALFTGNDVTPNEAGKTYQTLFKKTWRTHVTQSVHGDGTFKVRGFKGEYTVLVKHNGQEIKRESFSLTGNGQTVNIDLGTSANIIVG